MFERVVSPAALIMWLLIGAAFAAIWYAVTASWPPIWARLIGGMVLFAAVAPLEAALARRHRRRTHPITSHRKTPSNPSLKEARSSR